MKSSSIISLKKSMGFLILLSLFFWFPNCPIALAEQHQNQKNNSITFFDVADISIELQKMVDRFLSIIDAKSLQMSDFERGNIYSIIGMLKENSFEISYEAEIWYIYYSHSIKKPFLQMRITQLAKTVERVKATSIFLNKSYAIIEDKAALHLIDNSIRLIDKSIIMLNTLTAYYSDYRSE